MLIRSGPGVSGPLPFTWADHILAGRFEIEGGVVGCGCPTPPFVVTDSRHPASCQVPPSLHYPLTFGFLLV